MAVRMLNHCKLLSCLISDFKKTRLTQIACNCSAPSEDVRQTKVGSNENSAIVEQTREKRMSYLEARRLGLVQSKRSLSPTERTKQMLYVDIDSGSSVETNCSSGTKPDLSTDEASGDLTLSRGLDNDVTDVAHQATVRGDVPMADGEMVIAVRENVKRHQYLYRMFPLSSSKTFRCKYGTISHSDIIGHTAGTTFTTDLGMGVMIRKPSLDEFVVHMKRLPVISYPKDCCSMLMLIDASASDVILEAGTGSGAMTLFLSRAVGHSGCIHTFEARSNHHKRAVKNLKEWASSWNVGHPSQHWPDNVVFHLGKLQECDQTLNPGLLVDGAVIDMERPHEATPILAARLKSGRAAVLYIANITQVIEVAEFLRVHSLPLTIEKTLEVTHRSWLVNQARRHSGRALDDEASLATDSLENHQGQMAANGTPFQHTKDHVPKYVARPHSNQPGHSAFLVKLRKIADASAVYKI